jgi:O-succinylbenzoate synthase
MRFLFAHRRYALPFRAPVRTAHGPWALREGLIVRVTDATGAVGYGEIAPVPRFGTETIDETVAALQALGGQVDESQIAALPAQLSCTRHGLRSALAGCRAGSPAVSVPAVSLSNRSNPAVPELKGPSSLPVAALLPAGREALTAVAAKAERGFRVFKWKVGVGDNDEELGLLDDLLARLPSGARLRLDANGAWDRRRAERWLERCAERPIEFVEQPVAPTIRGADDLLLGLAGDFPTPLALDESLVHDGDVERWLAVGWPGLFVVKPALLADPAAVVAQLAQAKAKVVFSSALETAVGAQAALQLAFAWTGERRALGFGVYPLFADARFDGPPAAPFVSVADVAQLNPEAVWNALS